MSRIRHQDDRDGPDVPACYFVGREQANRLALASERTSDGERAVLVFEEETSTKAFLIVEGLGPEWKVIGHGRREAASLLKTCAAQDVKYGALTPPTVLTSGEEEPTVVSIEVLVDHLLDT